MSKVNFHFRKMEDADLVQLQELHKRCLNNIVTPDYFKWKYKDNPAGEAVAFVACDGDVIAGFYGVIPELFVIKGKRVTVFQSMDTMTNPDYQKMGLFTKLAQMTYDYLISKSGAVYIYGFAGSSSLPGFVNKLNWKLIFNTPYIFLSKYLFSLKSVFLSNRKRISVKEISFNQIDINGHHKNDLINVPIRPELSLEFLNWRVHQKPGSAYRVIKVEDEKLGSVGWAVISLEPGSRCKVEYLCRYSLWQHAHTNALMHFLFSSFHVKYIYTWKPADNGLLGAYKKQGFLSNPSSSGPFSYRVPFIVYSNTAQIEELNWFDRMNFDIQPLLQD